MKRLVVSLLLVIVLITGVVFAAGQEEKAFPSKPITLIVPWAPGGLGPIMMDFMAPLLSEELGVPVVLLYREGGGTSIGMQELQNSKPDGYTIGIASNSIFGAHFNTKGGVNYNNFSPLVSLTEDYFAFTVNSESQWKTFPQFFEYVKANPGKVQVGNSGAGATWHVATIVFNDKAGVQLHPVPYGGGGAAVTALMGNHIDATSVCVGDLAAVLPTGKLRILAIGAPERDPYYPDIPTIKESIGLDITVANWRGILAPKGVPADRLKILEDAFVKVTQNPSYLEFMAAQTVPSRVARSEEFTKRYFDEAEVILDILEASVK